MKKILTVVVLTAVTAAVAAPASQATAEKSSAAKAATAEKGAAVKKSNLAAARAKISDIIKNPKLMTSVMKTLTAKEQCDFLGEVNKAIEKMSGSLEEKAAIFLNVNRAALDGAEKGNLSAIVAETFATVPVAVLTVINESYAQDVFNRAADSKVTYTDEQFVKIAKSVMQVVNKRVATSEDSGLRSGFAALMMIRASNTESEEIKKALIAELPKNVQKTASEEWFPAALADGDVQSYEPMLGIAAGDPSRVVKEEFLRIAGPQQTDAMLSDLSGAATDPLLKPNEAQPVIDAVYAPVQHDFGNIGIGEASSDAAAQVGKVKAVVEEEQRAEALGYQYQTTH